MENDMKKTILVTGGAGYIGSHCVDELLKSGYEVVVIDNLATGHKESIPKPVVFYEGDICERILLDNVFKENQIDGVIHFAAKSLVGESVEQPLEYFSNNVTGTQVLAEVMRKYKVNKLVFSSSAATYGEPASIPILETALTNPTSPYGESKLMMEKILKWCDEAFGMKYVALRYFNVAGAKLNGSLGEDHKPESHLVPIILQTALGQRDSIKIFGNDYPTEDGTCVRDYVHVLDLVKAHILAINYLFKGNQSEIINLGSNKGFSVKEMVEKARQITGEDIPEEIVARRLGDPSILIASSQKAKQILGWSPQFTDVETIIKSAWNWHSKNPNGY